MDVKRYNNIRWYGVFCTVNSQIEEEDKTIQLQEIIFGYFMGAERGGYID